jgi:hypothetical protein
VSQTIKRPLRGKKLDLDALDQLGAAFSIMAEQRREASII